MENQENKKIIIIGSGPAGFTAAIYAARAGLKPLLFSGTEPGGQLTWTTEVENFPGFPQGIQGPELMKNFREQAVRFETEIIDAQIDKVNFSSQPFQVWSNDKEYQSEAVIIATGASSIWLGLESEQRLRGHGVSGCATCDGFFFKNKEVVVVGGGDAAMEEANYLTKFCTKVTIVHRRDKFSASKIMLARVQNNPKINFVINSEIEEVLGDKMVVGLKIKNKQTNQSSIIDCQGLFVAIGHKPNTDIFKGQIDLDDKKGYIIVKDSTKTSVSGVFAAGDVQDWHYRQAITAAASGCKAAIDAEKWLEEAR